jgi:hypothetical protein
LSWIKPEPVRNNNPSFVLYWRLVIIVDSKMKYECELGFGNAQGSIKVYIEHRPPMEEFAELNRVLPIDRHTIERINQAGGNHWRKIFNVLAKLMHGLSPSGCFNWQEYRDKRLLTTQDNLCLLFNKPTLLKSSLLASQDAVKIIAGKGYAQRCVSAQLWQWVSPRFAVIPEQRLIVSPYLDYRQLSNERLAHLQQLIAVM